MAKSKLTELDVDFIGEQEPLSTEEQLAISKFFASQMTNRASTKSIGRKKTKRTISA
jgi:hypothetical protein